MSSGSGWGSISSSQQTQFLQAAGLSQLPEPTALTAAQWQTLAGIVGEEQAQGVSPAPSYSAASPRLDPPASTGDWSSVMAKVAQLKMKMSELQQSLGAETVKGQKETMAKAHKEEMEKLQESLKKLEKASTSGTLGKIFGWIGAIVGVIAAAIATVATGGAAAPALAIAVVGLTMMILQETGAMETIIEELVKNPDILIALGAVLQLLPGVGTAIGGALLGVGIAIKTGALEGDKAKMALQLTMSAAMLVASVAGMVVTGGASAAGAMNAVFKVVGMIGQIVGGIAAVGSGASGISQAVYTKEAADAQADQKEIQAWLARLQATLSEEMDRLQEVIDQLNAGVVDASEILSDIAQSNQSVIARFEA